MAGTPGRRAGPEVGGRRVRRLGRRVASAAFRRRSRPCPVVLSGEPSHPSLAEGRASHRSRGGGDRRRRHGDRSQGARPLGRCPVAPCPLPHGAPAPGAGDPELVERPRRRRFSAEYKLEVGVDPVTPPRIRIAGQSLRPCRHSPPRLPNRQCVRERGQDLRWAASRARHRSRVSSA